MQITATVTDLTPRQWEAANNMLLTQYDLAGISNRVCATFVHAEQERHVEMPMGIFNSTLTLLRGIEAIGSLGQSALGVLGSAAERA